MKQKLETLIDNKHALNPCQLKKLYGNGKIACTFHCALVMGCPVIYVNSHDAPIIKKISEADLAPYREDA